MAIRLRQIVLVAADLAAAEAAIARELGIELCYRDPGVATFGLENALFPIGDQFLEVVSPTKPGTTAGRLIDKRGDGGYMVIVDVDDLEPFRARASELGVRVVHEATVGGPDGIVGLHLHPADIGGAILSIDRPEQPGEWPWAGPVWRQHVRTERVDAVLGVRIDANDPLGMATRWTSLLGPGAERRDRTVTLDGGGRIEFVSAGDRGEGVAGFVLHASDPAAAGTTEIAGCTFDLEG